MPSEAQARPATGLRAGQYRLVVTTRRNAAGLRDLRWQHEMSARCREIVEQMEERYGKAQRVWVMDRGMVSARTSPGSMQRAGASDRNGASGAEALRQR